MAAAAPSILWFRKGLRLHDNPALLAAAAGGAPVYPVFCLDPHFIGPARVGAVRMRFLLEALSDLDASLRRRGARLLVLRGPAVDVIPRAAAAWKVGRLCFEADTEPFAVARDAAVRAAVQALGAAVVAPVSHTLYDPAAILARNGGRPPLTYQAFLKVAAAVGPPRPPAADAPAQLPAVPAGAETALPPADCFPGGAVPSLSALGYPEFPSGDVSHFPGGETAGLVRLEANLGTAHGRGPAWVARFEKPKTSPCDITPSTTGLSPYLKFGCVSPALFYQRLAQAAAAAPRAGGPPTQPPVSLTGQLLWRDFFTCVGAGTPNFDRMRGNALCRQVPWRDEPAMLAAWEEGRTGYPWIDACMAQLRQQGWLHHLARHAVACFLTRGDLFQHWEKGQAVFDRLLIDADWSINAGNWLWLSASAFFSQYFRVYSPVAFPKSWDKEGAYVRHFVPVLSKYPAKYIYEPWTAPMEVQRAAGCIIGKDYPAPIVDHSAVLPVNMERMKKAYADARSGTGGPAAGWEEGEAGPGPVGGSSASAVGMGAGAVGGGTATAAAEAAPAGRGKRPAPAEAASDKKGKKRAQ